MDSGRSLKAQRLDWRLIAAALALMIAPTRPALARDLGIPPSHFKILNEEGTQIIGHGHYEIISNGDDRAAAFGENRFNNGEYDIERDRFALSGPGAEPRMLTYDHTFYASDGSIERESKVNFTSGQASCIRYVNGKADVTSATLELPPDTYAGSMIIVPIKNSLMRGNLASIVLHDVNCIPAPRVVKVRAYVNHRSTWKFYPGELTEVDIEPDLGWLNLLLAPFIPEIKTWFDPSKKWAFVGGNFQRYFKGPKVILARIPADDSARADAVIGAARTRRAKGPKN